MTRKEFNEIYLTKATRTKTKDVAIFCIAMGIFSLVAVIVLMQTNLFDPINWINLINPALYIIVGIVLLTTGSPTLYIVFGTVLLVSSILFFVIAIIIEARPNFLLLIWPVFILLRSKPNKLAYEAYKNYQATGNVPSQPI